MSDINHGTYGGAQAHQRRGEAACDECKAARAAYMRALRENPEQKASDLARAYAADRARRRLAALHPEEYRRFYAEEARTALGQPRPGAEVAS